MRWLRGKGIAIAANAETTTPMLRRLLAALLSD